MSEYFAFIPSAPVLRQTSFQPQCFLSAEKHRTVYTIPRRPRSFIVAEMPTESKDTAVESGKEEDLVESTIPENSVLDSDSLVLPVSYNIPSAVVFSGGICFYLGDIWLVPGFPLLLLGLFLSFQSLKVRLAFGPSHLILAKKTKNGLRIARQWRYDLITNWELWWKPVPILLYWKEAESYQGRGLIHFCPILFNGTQVLKELRARTSHLDKSKYD